MCGISGILGPNWGSEQLKAMLTSQSHRGPDDSGIFISTDRTAGLAHNRLSIIDLSPAGHQPMKDSTGRYYIIFNGEVYNYLELKKELSTHFTFQTSTDTEVVLNSFIRWGANCLDRFVGMFAFAIWDDKENTFFAARDRFGVKPFNYAVDNSGNLFFASEIKAIHAAGFEKDPDEKTWADYLVSGRYDHNESTFWKGVKKLPAGCYLKWENGSFQIKRWYDLASKTQEIENKYSLQDLTDRYFELMQENVRLRFRADVPVGINISGGLDSSALLGIVDKVQGKDNQVTAFTFYTGDDRYDELPWVETMIGETKHPLVRCLLSAKEVPDLAISIQAAEDEPFGGIPTLAYSKIFTESRERGIIVLLDGQGMDEQWAGYDYYRKANTSFSGPTIQGASSPAVQTQTLNRDFTELSDSWEPVKPYQDSLRNLQYRDAFFTKIPRALRFNDRISMRASTELREPFLDHRLFEFAFVQPEEYKIKGDQGKWFLRNLLKEKLPGKIVEAPKRPLQTPQREWLAGPLKDWVHSNIEGIFNSFGSSWFRKNEVMSAWQNYLDGKSDNSFYIWQWISLNMIDSLITEKQYV